MTQKITPLARFFGLSSGGLFLTHTKGIDMTDKTPEQVLGNYLYNQFDKLFDGVALFYEHESDHKKPGWKKPGWIEDKFYFLPNGFTYFIQAEVNLNLRPNGEVLFLLRKSIHPIVAENIKACVAKALHSDIPKNCYSLDTAFLYCVQKEIQHRAQTQSKGK